MTPSSPADAQAGPRQKAAARFHALHIAARRDPR